MYINDSVNGVFLMPKDVVKYLHGAKRTELRLVMYLFSKGNEFDVEKAAEDLGESIENINSALSYWRGTGVVTLGDDKKIKKKDVKTILKNDEKQYSTLDVATASMEDDEFKQIVKFTESTLGELPNAQKQAQLYYLYSGLGMQSDVIMGIIAHCASAGKTRMDYIKKTAEGIHSDGVVTYKELETYFKAKENYIKFESVVKRVIGAGDRAFTKSEKIMVETWEKDWKVDEEMLSLAYERTISLISKPSLPYMSKILENWYREGIDTADKVRESLEKQGQKSKAKSGKYNKDSDLNFDFEDIYEKP